MDFPRDVFKHVVIRYIGGIAVAVLILLGVAPNKVADFIVAPGWAPATARITFLVTSVILFYGLAYPGLPLKLRPWAKPRLKLQFDSDRRACVEKGPVGLTVRVLPVATTDKDVPNVRGRLLRILESSDDGATWTETNYMDPLDLRWTHQRDPEHFETRRVEKGVDQTLDVFYIQKDKNKLIPSVVPGLPRYLPDFNNGHWFRFDIMISGDEGAQSNISLKMRLGPSWDKPTIGRI